MLTFLVRARGMGVGVGMGVEVLDMCVRNYYLLGLLLTVYGYMLG